MTAASRSLPTSATSGSSTRRRAGSSASTPRAGRSASGSPPRLRRSETSSPPCFARQGPTTSSSPPPATGFVSWPGSCADWRHGDELPVAESALGAPAHPGPARRLPAAAAAAHALRPALHERRPAREHRRQVAALAASRSTGHLPAGARRPPRRDGATADRDEGPAGAGLGRPRHGRLGVDAGHGRHADSTAGRPAGRQSFPRPRAGEAPRRPRHVRVGGAGGHAAERRPRARPGLAPAARGQRRDGDRRRGLARHGPGPPEERGSAARSRREINGGRAGRSSCFCFPTERRPPTRSTRWKRHRRRRPPASRSTRSRSAPTRARSRSPTSSASRRRSRFRPTARRWRRSPASPARPPSRRRPSRRSTRSTTASARASATRRSCAR